MRGKITGPLSLSPVFRFLVGCYRRWRTSPGPRWCGRVAGGPGETPFVVFLAASAIHVVTVGANLVGNPHFLNALESAAGHLRRRLGGAGGQVFVEIDAFTSEPFKGNPAAVCLLESAEDEAAGDEWMQSVASEFNISETAFLSRAVVGSGDLTGGASSPRFNLRWFTPATEVVLCGHGTLAAAHFLWTVGLINDDVIEFVTKSGILTAKKVRSNLVATTDLSPSKAEGLYIELDFPAVPSVECIDAEIPLIPETLNGAAIVNVQQTTADQQLIVELSSAKEILNLHPNYEEIHKYAGGNMIATARAPAGSMFDFFTRYFAPKFGINEDPVCGSAHCILAPYWSKKLGKSNLIAYMASPRSGILHLRLVEETQRVYIRGEAVTVMVGTLLV